MSSPRTRPMNRVTCAVVCASLGIVLVITCICLIRAALVENPQIYAVCKSNDSDYISESRGLSSRLSNALKFKTITQARGNYDKNALREFIHYLTNSYPKVHSTTFINREIINNLSLLYTIKGSDSSLKPYMLAGHLDVVPSEDSGWVVPPFDGIIKDGFIWGRGSIDCKHTVLGILEALEFLLEKSFQPQRSFYLAFGHDEEGGGVDGAAHINELLTSRNIQLEYILDEGTFVFNDSVPGVKVPVAMVGVSEKGSLTQKLDVKGTPGHSSVPQRETAIVILAEALAKLKGDIFPSMFGYGPEKALFEAVAPYSTYSYKIVYANLWLFSPLLSWHMGKDRIMSSIIRTTTAVTMVSGGIKENILPASASAVINHRIHPSQTVQQTFNFVKHVINDDRVEQKELSSSDPHPISPYLSSNYGYSTIAKSIRQIFHDCCIAPVTLVGNTDTKWYLNLTNAIYRFSPVNMYPHEVSRFHGHNEKISVKNYEQLVNFYLHLIKNSDTEEIKLRQHTDEL